MKIGLLKEIKNNEFRVGLTPGAAGAYIAAGHEVLVEKDAGAGSAYPDGEYAEVGCKIIDSAEEIWHAADMIIKVKNRWSQSTSISVKA